MKLRPILASEFVTFTPTFKELIIKAGGVPVNDKLMSLWTHDYDICLPHGGRGGGKSEAVCDKLIDDCINHEYFKCYFGRKVFDTLRGTSYATLLYCIKKNKVKHLFSFSEADNSSMIITCLENGNKFIPFGSDKADKLKSIKDPTHVWAEEFDQFTADDFKEIFPTLRTTRGVNRFIGTFNTYAVQLDNWIIKTFFPNLYNGTDKEDNKIADLLKGVRIIKPFVNFTDNYFIDQDKYAQSLMLAAMGNITKYNGLAGGDWGVNENNNPWAFAFDKGKHVAKTELFATRAEFLWLLFDFNRNPAACLVLQNHSNAIWGIECIKLMKSGTEGLCNRILEKYPNYVYLVGGDYSGKTASSIFQEEVSNYTMIVNRLQLTENQLRLHPNPRLEKNRTLVNAVLYKTKVQFCPVKCRPVIYDLENARVRADGTLVKNDRDDPAQQLDFLDDFRYYCNEEMQWVLNYNPA